MISFFHSDAQCIFLQAYYKRGRSDIRFAMAPLAFLRLIALAKLCLQYFSHK